MQWGWEEGCCFKQDDWRVTEMTFGQRLNGMKEWTVPYLRRVSGRGMCRCKGPVATVA